MNKKTKHYREKRLGLMRKAALMYARGKTIAEISRELSVPETTLQYWHRGRTAEWQPLYDEAVKLVGEVEHRRFFRVGPAVIEEAARMQAAGATPQKIGERFGVSPLTVGVWKTQNRQTWDTAYLAAVQPFDDVPAAPAPRPRDPSKPARSLWSLAQVMFARRANIRRKTTKNHYRYAVNCFGKFLCRVPTEADLDDDLLMAWLQSLMAQTQVVEKPRSVETMRSYVERVRALWRFLNDRGEIPTRPTFALPPLPEPVPVALDESQIRRLFEAALCRPGFVCGVPARYWWSALFGFVFCTSERKGATFALRWEWIDLRSKSVSIPAAVRKGGLKNATYRLWDEVVALLARIAEPRRELVFPWMKSEATYYHHYGKILADAQMPNTRKYKTHSLRVTHNTWTRVMTGEHSPLLLHADKATSERHYEDRRFTVREAVKLPIPWQRPAPAIEPIAPAADVAAMAWL